MEFNCTSCNHPACIMRGQGDHYCGNYMASKPYTLKVRLGYESKKDKLHVSNDNRDSCNADTCGNDCVADT